MTRKSILRLRSWQAGLFLRLGHAIQTLNDGYDLVGLSDLAPTLHQPQQVSISARSAVREIARRRPIHGSLRWWPELSAGPSPIHLLMLRLNMSGIGVDGRQVKAQNLGIPGTTSEKPAFRPASDGEHTRGHRLI
jgi:hypothetical protein